MQKLKAALTISILALILVFALYNSPRVDAAFNPFGTKEITVDFNLNGDGNNVDSIAFWEAPDPTQSLMFVTAKGSSLVEVWKYPYSSSSSQQAALKHSCISGGTNGVWVDQEDDILYVTVAFTDKICVFNLPNLGFVKTINTGSSISSNEPNLTLLKTSNGQKRLYTSYNTEVRIQNPSTGANLGTFKPVRGLETMWADNFDQIIYIPDEGGRSGVYAYNPDGSVHTRNGANKFGDSSIFNSDEEGIWVYSCPANGVGDNGEGFIIISDQIDSSSTGNDYEIFNRRTWQHLGKIKLRLPNGNYVYNTDGIASTQQNSPAYPGGIFVAIQNDTSVAGVAWNKILQATGLSCGTSSSPIPTPPPGTATPNPTTSPSTSIPSPVGGGWYVITPTDDAMVSEGNQSKNYGSDNLILASDYSLSNIRETYIKFNLSGIVGNIISAKLKLTPALDRSVDKTVHLVTNNNWNEGNIAWNNKPSMGTQIGSISTNTQTGVPVEINLNSSQIQQAVGGQLSIGITNTGTRNTFSVESKENSNAPQLLIQTSGGTNPTATPSSGDLSGDANGDKKVDGLDYVVWLVNYNTTTSQGASKGDFDRNEKVDGLDYVIWLTNYGKVGGTPTTPTAKPATSTPTPKPATATPKPATATPTAKPATAIPSPTSTGTPIPPPSSSAGILISRNEIMSLPTSGSAWNNIVSWANQNTSPDISNQDNQADAVAVAAALVCVRQSSASHCSKARSYVMDAIGTEAGGRTLALGRNLAGYIIAADLVGFNSSSDETKFRNWVSSVRTKTLDGKTLISTHEDRPNNWGTHAGASRIAAAIFLGDNTDLQRAANVFHGWLGNRSLYSGFSYGNLGWQANPSQPVGINPQGAKISINGAQRNVDGVLPDDQRRQGEHGCQTVSWPPCKENYVWEALQGALAQAWFLHRKGMPAFQWQNQALRRSVQWLHEGHFSDGKPMKAEGDDSGLPYLVDHIYGTNYRSGVGTSAPSKNGFSFYDWYFGL